MSAAWAPATVWNRLRSTYWFVPSLVTLAAMALGIVLPWADRNVDGTSDWVSWAYGGGSDGARSLLSAVAGSMVTVVSVTFSVIIVALTVSSQHFGPQVLNKFMRDVPSQLVLGTFIGTFAYCLLVLRTVQGSGGDNYDLFVPHLSVTMAVVLSLLSVAALIFYVHHVSMSLRVSEITLGVAHDFEAAVERLYPERMGQPAPQPGTPSPAVPADAFAVSAATSGYVQTLEPDELLETAREHDATIWTVAVPGTFVVEGSPLAMVHPPDRPRDAINGAVRGAYFIGEERTVLQDADFAVQQLVGVALRALSPGVNEPFTAIMCIDRLGQGLAKLAARDMPAAARTDDEGVVRVVSEPQTLIVLLRNVVEPIALFSERNPALYARLLEMLGRLGRLAHRREDRDEIARQADVVWDTACAKVEHLRTREELGQQHRLLMAQLGRRAPRSSATGSPPAEHPSKL